MKLRDRVILCLLIAGTALFAAVRFYAIPQRDAAQNLYLAAQQEPVTHDFGAVLKYKSAYVGNASNDAGLFNHLPLSDAGASFQIDSTNLALEVDYKTAVKNLGEARVKRTLLYNSAAAFTLVGNLQALVFRFPDVSFRVRRADAEVLYPDFKNISDPGTWKNLVQSKMGGAQYVSDSFTKTFRTER